MANSGHMWVDIQAWIILEKVEDAAHMINTRQGEREMVEQWLLPHYIQFGNNAC